MKSKAKDHSSTFELTGRRNLSCAKQVARLLKSLDVKLVCAESCTGGMVSASMTSVPGISNHYCGSLVTYRPKSKRGWLKVQQQTIDEFTTESEEIVREMALCALRVTPEADFSAAVVGHLGPDAPEDKDGQIFVGIGCRDRRGKPTVQLAIEQRLPVGSRRHRQSCATELVLQVLVQTLAEVSANREEQD